MGNANNLPANLRWTKLKAAYVLDHLSQTLKTPYRRLSALDKIEELLRLNYSEVINDALLLKKVKKEALKLKLAKWKKKKLNSAEISVLNGLYKFLVDL